MLITFKQCCWLAVSYGIRRGAAQRSAVLSSTLSNQLNGMLVYHMFRCTCWQFILFEIETLLLFVQWMFNAFTTFYMPFESKTVFVRNFRANFTGAEQYIVNFMRKLTKSIICNGTHAIRYSKNTPNWNVPSSVVSWIYRFYA